MSVFEGLECLDDGHGIAGGRYTRNQQVVLASVQKKAESFAPASDGGGEKSAV